MKTTGLKELHIPNWAMKHLLQWVERAYRRGFQHGLLASEEYQWNSEQDGFKFRYETAGGAYPKDAREPLHKMKITSLEERHLECDGISGGQLFPEPNKYIFVKD